MRPRKQILSIVQKQNRNKKTRRLSSAFGAEIPRPLALSPLSWISLPLQSLLWSLALWMHKSLNFINNERPYAFQLYTTDDGGHYLLQAVTKREMNKWLETISRVPKIAAKRRLTYLGHSPKPQISDHIHPIMDPQAVSFFYISCDIFLSYVFF